MWIMTCDGECLNADRIESIKVIGVGTYARTTGDKNYTAITRNEDVRLEIMTNIASGTKILEYGGHR